MRNKDLANVSRGAYRLADAMTRKHGGSTADLINRALGHGQDILRSIVTHYSNNSGPNSNIGAASIITAVINALQSGSAPTNPATSSHSSPSSYKEKQKDEDVFGFPSLKNDADASAAAREAVRTAQSDANKFEMQEKAVPATQFGRVVGFGTLATQLAIGSITDRIGSFVGLQQPTEGISEENAEILTKALCRMRGAALKLGQMMSIQDTEGYLSPALANALERVRAGADYMPQKQLRRQLVSELGPDWETQFEHFSPKPIAAASIGQVHQATLLDGREVAVKVQYPGVANSIDSDLKNLKALVAMVGILPSGLYIDQIIKVVGSELRAECDYRREAEAQARYRDLILHDGELSKHCSVPVVIPSLSAERLITTEFVRGIPLDQVASLDQGTRNAIARTMLVLTIRELFEWRFMQTDPNFANFLYNTEEQVIHLIDFGATRSYPKPFVDGYMRMVWAAANEDPETILEVSQQLGFLTGDEVGEMVESHVAAGMILGEPFREDKIFHFGDSQLTQRIGQHGNTFVKHRLTAPPTEVYSLHRKLAGAFLLCIKLRANIKCRDILERTYQNYVFEENSE